MNLTDINQINALLSANGFRFSKSMGQNFLTDAAVPSAIAEASGAGSEFGVLEIGPGIGCLTKELSARAAKVVAVELDSSLEKILKLTLAGCDNVSVIFGDILKTDMAELIDREFSGLRPIVCANLPYNVTTPVLTALLKEPRIESITVMIQKEVAQRICARPGTPEYGAFGIFACWYAEPRILFDVPPSCFVPQPKVTSSVIRLERRSCPPAETVNSELMFRIIRAAFNQRRKTLLNALSSGLPEYSKAVIAETLEACEISPMVRGEMLDFSDFAKITNKIAEN